jgi:hypothetical protein
MELCVGASGRIRDGALRASKSLAALKHGMMLSGMRINTWKSGAGEEPDSVWERRNCQKQK